jgi:hypothetical protein
MNWFFTGSALALLLWFFALLYLKSYVRRRTSPDHILTLLQEEVRQLEADMDETTERDLQLLEEKIKTLRELCTEVEKRIVLYGRELERREKEAAFAALSLTPKEASPENAAPAPTEKGPKKQARQRQKSPTHSAPLLQRLEGKDPAAEAADSAYRIQTGRPRLQPQLMKVVVSPESLNIKPPPVKDRIAEFHRTGLPPRLIAERLGLTIGEVELYIAMVDDKKAESKK